MYQETSKVVPISKGNPCRFIFHNKFENATVVSFSGFEQFYPRFIHNITEYTVHGADYEWGAQVNTTLIYGEYNYTVNGTTYNHTFNDNSVTPVFKMEPNSYAAVQMVITPNTTYTWDNLGPINQWIFNSLTDEERQREIMQANNDTITFNAT